MLRCTNALLVFSTIFHIQLEFHFSFIAQKMKFPIKDFLSKCDQNPQFSEDLVTFTEEIPGGKLHFFCAVSEQ